MSNEVQFDFENNQQYQYAPRRTSLADLVMKYSGGIIKDKTSAYLVILGSVIFAVVTSFVLAFSGKELPYQPSQEEILRAMNSVQN